MSMLLKKPIESSKY